MILDSEKIYAKLILAGDDWSDKNAAADLLERNKDSVLSQIMAQHPEKSNAAAETLALASPQYSEHIRAMVEARRLANRARVLYDSLKTLSELRRSEESSRRAEMGLR